MDSSDAFVASQNVELTCNAAGDAFEGAPSAWPTCVAADAAVTCAVPVAPAGYDALPDTTPAMAIGGTLEFTCTDASMQCVRLAFRFRI